MKGVQSVTSNWSPHSSVHSVEYRIRFRRQTDNRVYWFVGFVVDKYGQPWKLKLEVGYSTPGDACVYHSVAELNKALKAIHGPTVEIDNDDLKVFVEATVTIGGKKDV